MGTSVGYARCSTDKQDLAAQRQQLAALGVAADRMYVDRGLTGTLVYPDLMLGDRKGRH